MSRIDLSIREKKTNEWVINKKFCRTPALEFFCENSKDEKLQFFDYNIMMGIDINKDNISEHLGTIQYVINFLTTIPVNKRSDYFDFYKEPIYLDFIADLTNSLDYLNNFMTKNNIEDYVIEIVQ